MKSLILGIFFSVAATLGSAATLTITVSQSGADVTLTGSGSIDLSGLGPATASNLVTFDRSQFNLFAGGVAGQPVTQYEPAVAFTPMSTTGFAFSSVAGDPLLIQLGGFVLVEQGYNSGDPLNFVWTVAGTSVDALNLNFGTLASFADNKVTLVRDATGVSKVPLPASGLLLLAGLGLLAGRSKRRSRG